MLFKWGWLGIYRALVYTKARRTAAHITHMRTRAHAHAKGQSTALNVTIALLYTRTSLSYTITYVIVYDVNTTI